VASLSEKIGSSIQSALQDRSLADLVDEDEKRAGHATT
jgi:hypothetical protein